MMCLQVLPGGPAASPGLAIRVQPPKADSSAEFAGQFLPFPNNHENKHALLLACQSLSSRLVLMGLSYFTEEGLCVIN